MKIIEVNCNHCGALLQVNEDTRFATCGSCKSRLAVRHSETATFTSVLEGKTGGEQSVEKNPAAAGSAQPRPVQAPVARPPVVTGRRPSIIAGIFSILFGILAGGALVAISRNGAPWFFALIGLVFFGAGVYNGFKAISMAMKQ